MSVVEAYVENPELEKRFNYHAPGELARPRHARINDATKALAYELSALCPASRELSLAITKLVEVRSWANAAVAIHQELLTP